MAIRLEHDLRVLEKYLSVTCSLPTMKMRASCRALGRIKAAWRAHPIRTPHFSSWSQDPIHHRLRAASNPYLLLQMPALCDGLDNVVTRRRSTSLLSYIYCHETQRPTFTPIRGSPFPLLQLASRHTTALTHWQRVWRRAPQKKLQPLIFRLLLSRLLLS